MAPTRGPVTSAITVVFTVVSTVFVAARFFTRTYLVKSIKQDDWWILCAWVVAVGFSASICAGVHDGLGKHRDDIAESHLHALRNAEYTFSILYQPALMLTKTSIIAFYISVMSKDVDKVFKWCNWLTLATVNVAGLALTFLAVFQCSPVSAGFTFPVPENASCTDIVTLYLSSAPVNIITDIAILFLPMPILTGLRLPKKQKIILLITFSFGTFVAVVDVIRLAYLQNAASAKITDAQTHTGTKHHYQDNNDFSWDAALSFMWSAVEVHLGIICACVPSLKPLFLKFLPQFIKDDQDDSPATSNNSINAGEPRTMDQAIRGNPSMLNNPAAFRKPVIGEYSGDDDGDNMGFLNMLASRDGDAPELKPKHTALSLVRTTTHLSKKSTNKNAASDFGFVNMSGTKNMLKLNNRQSWWPIGVVTIIFFLWGFAYGLLDVLNAQFQRVVQVPPGRALGLHAAYYGGYLVGPLTLGRFTLRRYGFKASMMVGLCVYGCGTLVFWPSAVLTSYTAFVLSNFIVAFGLSCLEIAANPYIALCGPLEYAEVRLNLSQAFQAVGTVCSPLLAGKVFFDNITASPTLVDVQWAYLGIAIFVFALAIIFYYIPLPEASDEELEELADRHSALYHTDVALGPKFKIQVIYLTAGMGVFSQWCYVGVQECIGQNTQTLYRAIQPNSKLSASDFQTVGHTVFAAGRFLAAFLNYILKPRWILLLLWTGLIIMCALQMALGGIAAATIQQMIYFFEAGIFSIIFAISMRGMGAHTKTASAFVTAAVSGGAVFPVIQWAAANSRGVRYSYCVPLAAAAFGAIFAFYLNLVPAARLQVDPIHERRKERRAQKKLQRSESRASTATQSNEFGITGIIARRKKQKATEKGEKADAQHVAQSEPVPSHSPTFPGFNLNDENDDSILQTQAPKGIVGGLKPWGKGGGGTEEVEESGPRRSESSSRDRSGNASGPPITNKRPVLDYDDDDDDDDLDYHNVIGQNGQRHQNTTRPPPEPERPQPTKHKPTWDVDGDEDGDDIDDYHKIMKQM